MKLLMFLSIPLFLFSCTSDDPKLIDNNLKIEKSVEFVNQESSSNEPNDLFKSDRLKTDTSKKSISLDDVLDWWPGKDWIPSIDNPKFLDINSAEKDLSFLNDSSEWLSIQIWNVARFYPYNILVWHEIVNDTIDDKSFSVTFCPLCWSWIAYNRVIEWQEVNFGVSWKLFESNLLMYDDLTESLWSQSIWEAVVWEKTWTKLEFIKSDLLTFKQFKTIYPNWEVLSDKTWSFRNYNNVPYWDYDSISNTDLYFPVSNEDLRILPKEIMYAINNNWETLVFLLKDLVSEKQAEFKMWNNLYKAEYNNWLVDVTLDWKIIPGYYEMWFSWVNHNEGSGNVWRK